MKDRIIIIGFGPAGMACAIQLRRMGLDPMVIEKDRPGGMLHNAFLIENYPGFPTGISGEKLAGIMTRQAGRFGIRLVRDEITKVGYKDNVFILTGASGNYSCDFLVIASGTIPSLPQLFQRELAEKGLIHSDIMRLKGVAGKIIGIVGAGDAAFDYSLSLAGNGNKVFIFNRSDRIRALKILQERVFINEKIKYFENTSVERLEIHPEHGFQGICKGASQNLKFSLDYLIFATGRNPALDFLDRNILAGKQHLQERHRLYEIGDVHNNDFRQLSLAVGDGVKAAMEIFHHESNQ